MISICLRKLNSAPTHFKSDRTFELTLTETLTATPAEIHILEERYLGKFSAHIRKNLYIMQYTFPDIMYAVNRLSSHNYTPSAPDFQGINQLIRYIYGRPHLPIMYTAGINGNTTHDIHKEVYPGNFQYQNKYDGLVDFAY